MEVECLFLTLPSFLVQMQSTQASWLPFRVSGELRVHVWYVFLRKSQSAETEASRNAKGCVSSRDTYYLGNWEIFPNEFPERKQSHPEQQEQEG